MDGESSFRDSQDSDGARTLRDACLSWCDPALVAEMRAAYDVKMPKRPEFTTSDWAPGRYSDWDDAGEDPYEKAWRRAVRPIKQRRDTADYAVVTDFRNRLACGEIELRGLRTRPSLAAQIEIVPRIWAKLLQFRFDENAIRAQDAEYIDIRAYRVGATPANALGQSDVCGIISVPPASCRAEPPRAGGRPAFPFNALVSIARELPRSERHINKVAAPALRAAFCDRFPHERCPAESMILRHVSRIYAAIADASADGFDGKEKAQKPQKPSGER